MGMNTSEDIKFFGDVLQQLRKSKHWNQKQLAERIGVSRETISLWERGVHKPEVDTILYEIVRVLQLTEQEKQILFDKYTVTALKTSFHKPPFKRNLYFTGRISQLDTLHKLLVAGKKVALTQAISGLGGIGKTQLAVEYAYRYQNSYHDIFWVTADTHDNLMTSYVQLAALLHLSENDEQDQNKVKEAVQQWFSRHTGWLLILDNIEHLDLIDQFVPIDRQGAVLLTTRRHVTEPVAQALELKLLSEEEAVLFLLMRTKVLEIGMSLKDASEHDIADAGAIAQLVDNLPLALDQAGAYILETQCSFADYLALFKKYQIELLQRRIGEKIPTDHPESVAATFMLNFQQVQQRSEIAAELLRMCAFLASDSIRDEIFVQGASYLGTVLQPLSSDKLLLNQAIEVLSTFSLVQRDAVEKTLSVHRLVQAVLQDTLTESEHKLWAERIINAINKTFPNVRHETWLLCERLVAQVRVCAELFSKWEIHSIESIYLFTKMGYYQRKRTRYEEAKQFYHYAFTISEQNFGFNSLETATILSHLAGLDRVLGEYVQSQDRYRQVLAIQKQALNHNDSRIATTLNNLALICQALNQYSEAEEAYKQALEVRETTVLLTNFASLCQRQSKYKEAESLYKKVLDIRKKKLGTEHSDVAVILHRLGTLYRDMKMYERAEKYLLDSLTIREKLYAPDGLVVASSLSSIAQLYREQQKYEEAEPLYLKVLATREKILGSYHPKVAMTAKGLAELYREQQKYEEAEPLYLRALTIQERTLPSDSSKVIAILENLKQVYQAKGENDKLEGISQYILAIRDKYVDVNVKSHEDTDIEEVIAFQDEE